MKLVLIGDSSVGKSSLANRFQDSSFKELYQLTIAGAYFQKVVSVPDPKVPNRTQQVQLHIWDTGGQEQYRSMVQMYYRDADAAIICFDVSNPKSFQSVFYWINEMNNNCNNDRSNFVLAMAGNKSDLDESQKKITFAQASEVAQENQMIYGETSAKTGEGVEDLFLEIV